MPQRTTFSSASAYSQGEWLDGGKFYRLHVPANAPAKNFWSITAYDVNTRCFIDTTWKIADRSSRQGLTTNADGSVDLYLGPKWNPCVVHGMSGRMSRRAGPTGAGGLDHSSGHLGSPGA